MKDLKEALSSRRKPDTTHVRSNFRRYVARACEYGDDKYQRANYLRPTATGSPRENFERFRAYLRACVDHVSMTLDAMEDHQALDPDLLDEDGMRAAAFAPDFDQSRSDFPPSGLPHVAAAGASLQMAIEQAVKFGLLPPDPGRPWDGNVPLMPIERPAGRLTHFIETSPGEWRCAACDGITRGVRPWACSSCGVEE